MFGFDYMAPAFTCKKCGQRMSFPNGWYPTELICSNCGQILDVKKEMKNISFSNIDFNESPEEAKKRILETLFSNKTEIGNNEENSNFR